MDVDDPEEIKSGNESGLTALMKASRDGDLERVRSLLDEGADVNELNNVERRAIDYSFDGEHHEVSLLLLQKDSIFPQPAFLINGSGRPKRRGQWEALIHRNSRIREFFRGRDDFHEKLSKEKLDIVEDSIKRRLGSEEEASRYRIWVSTKGHSALYKAAASLKHDNWALLKRYGFIYAPQGEEHYMLQRDYDDNFTSALSRYIVSPSGLQIERMVTKVKCAKVPGKDSSVYVESLRRYFQELDKEEPTSCVLRCLQHDWTLKICLDFNGQDVRGMKSFRNGGHIVGNADFQSNKIYAVAMEWEDFDSSDIVGNLAHELTHMALQYVFENDGLPYRKGNDEVEEEYKKIMEDVLSPENLPNCDAIIQRVAGQGNRKAHELIVRVTEMISKYRLNVEENGYARLKKQAPALLDFFTQRVLPEMQEYASREKLRGNLVNMKYLTAFYDERIEVSRSDAGDGLIQHGYLQVLSVSNLKLGISHLKKSLGDVTCVDLTKYRRDEDDFIMAVLRGDLAKLAIVWDIGGMSPKFCNSHKRCTSRICFVADFRKVENACILVVPKNAEIPVSLDYTLGDLTENCKQWLLGKELDFGGTNVMLKDILHTVVGDECRWAEIVNPIVMSELIDEEKLVLGRAIANFPAQTEVIEEGSIVRALQVSQVEFSTDFLKSRPNDVFFIKDSYSIDLKGKEEVSVRYEMWNEEEIVPKNIRLFTLGKVVTAKSDSSFLENLCHMLRDRQHMGDRLHFAHLFQLTSDGKLVHITSRNCRLSHRNTLTKSWCSRYMNTFLNGPNEPLIIADASGSGKSFWVNKTASSLKKSHPAYWVGVVKLSAVAHVYSEWGEMSVGSRDEVINGLFELLGGGGGSLIERHFFELYCLKDKRCFIFFDGFDEVSPKYKGRLVLFLKKLVEWTKVRLCVTTRGEDSPMLERHLSTLSYCFVPLNNDQQAAIMDSQWKARLLQLSKEERTKKIEDISKGLQSSDTFNDKESISRLVEELKSSEGSDLKHLDFRHVAECMRKVMEEEGDEEFLGIPLHVWMLTTVAYEQNFNMQGSISLYQLYKRFIELKIDLYCEEKISLPDDRSGEVTRNSFRNYEWLKDFAKSHVLGDEPCNILGDDISLQKALSMGLVSCERDSFVFVHETFGEFLFFLWLEDRREDETINKIWFDEVLYSRKYQKLRQFINVMFLCTYKESPRGETEIIQRRESPLKEKRRRFVKRLQKCIYTSIVEGHMGVLRFLVDRSKECLPEMIFDRVDWDIKELEAFKALEELEGKPFHPKNDCQNALKFCGKLVSRTLLVKKSGIRHTKVHYLKLLTELLRVAAGCGLAEKVEELLIVEGVDWMGIGNYHLWRDSSGKDLMGQLFDLLRGMVSHHVLREKIKSVDGEKIVENAAKCSWDTLINFVEPICEIGEDMKLLLEGDNFYGAWVSIVEKCSLSEVDRAWKYFTDKHHEVNLSKEVFFQCRKRKKKSVLSAAFLNRRNPEVSTLVWQWMNHEMGGDKCKTFLTESNFWGLRSKRRLEYLSTFGFLRLLEDLLQNKFLSSDEAKRLLFPLGINCRAIFEKCRTSRSLLSLYTLQSILKDLYGQSVDVLLSLTNHYVSMTSLCFGNRRKSGVELDILEKEIGKEFAEIIQKLKSIPFVEKDRKGRLCRLSSKAKGADMKSFLVLFDRQVQLERDVLGNDSLVNRFKRQWANVYRQLPSYECRGGGRDMKTKAHSMAYIFGILSVHLEREKLSECLTDESISYDTKEKEKLNEIVNWSMEMDI